MSSGWGNLGSPGFGNFGSRRGSGSWVESVLDPAETDTAFYLFHIHLSVLLAPAKSIKDRLCNVLDGRLAPLSEDDYFLLSYFQQRVLAKLSRAVFSEEMDGHYFSLMRDNQNDPALTSDLARRILQALKHHGIFKFPRSFGICDPRTIGHGGDVEYEVSNAGTSNRTPSSQAPYVPNNNNSRVSEFEGSYIHESMYEAGKNGSITDVGHDNNTIHGDVDNEKSNSVLANDSHRSRLGSNGRLNGCVHCNCPGCSGVFGVQLLTSDLVDDCGEQNGSVKDVEPLPESSDESPGASRNEENLWGHPVQQSADAPLPGSPYSELSGQSGIPFRCSEYSFPWPPARIDHVGNNSFPLSSDLNDANRQHEENKSLQGNIGSSIGKGKGVDQAVHRKPLPLGQISMSTHSVPDKSIQDQVDRKVFAVDPASVVLEHIDDLPGFSPKPVREASFAPLYANNPRDVNVSTSSGWVPAHDHSEASSNPIYTPPSVDGMPSWAMPAGAPRLPSYGGPPPAWSPPPSGSQPPSNAAVASTCNGPGSAPSVKAQIERMEHEILLTTRLLETLKQEREQFTKKQKFAIHRRIRDVIEAGRRGDIIPVSVRQPPATHLDFAESCTRPIPHAGVYDESIHRRLMAMSLEPSQSYVISGPEHNGLRGTQAQSSAPGG